MIYTVTLNPSIDYIVRLDSFVHGITNRTTSEEYYYGGKGINVSCVLAELDLDSTAYGFVAGFTGKEGMVLFERMTDGYYLGHNSEYIEVKVKSDRDVTSLMLPVHYDRADGEYLEGHIIGG